MNSSLKIFLQFFYRDWYVYFKRIRYYIINYCLIYPLVYSISFIYLTPQTFSLGDQTETVVVSLLSGNIMLVMLNITWIIISGLLYDFEYNRYIDFQIMRLQPAWVILEYISFASLFGFLFIVPFFPMSKLIVRNMLDTSHASWPQVVAVVFAGAWCCAAYTMLAVCAMKNVRQISTFWIRFSLPLFMLGGFWVPWSVTYKASPLLGNIMRLNPFMYFTEGIRRAITGSADFFSVPTCIAMLLGYAVIFYAASLYFFNKKVDPV